MRKTFAQWKETVLIQIEAAESSARFCELEAKAHRKLAETIKESLRQAEKAELKN